MSAESGDMNRDGSRGKVIRFEDFQPGVVLGEASITVDLAMLASLQKIYALPWTPGQPVPLPLCTALMMRAYLQVVSPRPPGNVHARQRLRLDAPIHAGDSVLTRVACTGKELKSGRRWVSLEAIGSVGERAAYAGQLTLIWAA